MIDVPKHNTCPICERTIPYSKEFPTMICGLCGVNPTDEYGKPVSFGNDSQNNLLGIYKTSPPQHYPKNYCYFGNTRCNVVITKDNKLIAYMHPKVQIFDFEFMESSMGIALTHYKKEKGILKYCGEYFPDSFELVNENGFDFELENNKHWQKIITLLQRDNFSGYYMNEDILDGCHWELKAQGTHINQEGSGSNAYPLNYYKLENLLKRHFNPLRI